MKKNQSTKGNIATREQQGNRKENTSNRIDNRPDSRKSPDNILRKKSGGMTAVSKAIQSEMMEHYPAEILKTCNDLKAICVKIDKLEKEKRKLIYMILEDVPPRHRRAS